MPIDEKQILLIDDTTNNVSTSRHGLVPKAPNDVTKTLDGTGNFSFPGNTEWDLLRSSLGSDTIFETPWKMKDIATTSTLVSNTAYFVPFWAWKNVPLTGLKYQQGISGLYTSNQTNQGGIYSYSAGVITLVAFTNDDGNMWKQTASATVKKAFSSSYNITVGPYFFGAVWNSSATTTAPTLGAGTPFNAANVAPLDFTNSAKISCLKTTSNSLPSSVTLSTTTNSNLKFWFAVY